jgi:hypothetical protein
MGNYEWAVRVWRECGNYGARPPEAEHIILPREWAEYWAGGPRPEAYWDVRFEDGSSVSVCGVFDGRPDFRYHPRPGANDPNDRMAESIRGLRRILARFGAGEAA